MKKETPILKFKGYNLAIELNKYSDNNGTALALFEIEDHSPFAMATINMPLIELNENEVIIKNYSENEGIEELLIKNGIIEKTGRTVNGGFVNCNICKLLI